ncbi:MAG: DUF2085 domain-containing protein [Candidatus Hermodarchaeota archaeon]
MSDIETQQKNTLRLIFVNILVVVFIIMSYIYISAAFGSISTPFIGKNEFSLVFGVSLFVYTFFSIIAGPVPAFIAGFLGELLFQLAFYERVFVDWCFVVAIFGLVVGIYKYEPLKYQKVGNILFICFVVIIDSFSTMLLIVSFQIPFHATSLALSTIFINFGLKFFLEALLSAIIGVPILLFIYDKVLASKERHLYYLILTHHDISASDHTFYFQFGRTKIYLCSRCSGIVLGVIMSIFITYLVQQISNTSFSSEIAILLVTIFPLPGLIDWGTQKLMLRKSTTSSRLFTGFIIGVAAHFISFTGDFYFLALTITTIYFSVLIILIFLGQKKLMRKLRKELTQESSEELELQ